MNSLGFLLRSTVATARSFSPLFPSISSVLGNSVFARDFGTGIKSKRSVVKRFEFTGTGKLKRYKAGKRHGNTGKTREYLRDAMHPRYLSEGSMYSSIKKMIC